MTRNPPCRDCGTRASQSALAIQAKRAADNMSPALTIRELVGDLPLHFCTVCAMFHGLARAALVAGIAVEGHDMVPCTPCNGNSQGSTDRPTQ